MLDEENEDENSSSGSENDNGPVEITSEDEVNQEKKKLKALGLEKASKAGFNVLLEHRKPEERKSSDKKPFVF